MTCSSCPNNFLFISPEPLCENCWAQWWVAGFNKEIDVERELADTLEKIAEGVYDDWKEE